MSFLIKTQLTSENFGVVEIILSSAVCKNPSSNTYYIKAKRNSEGCVLIIAEDELPICLKPVQSKQFF